MNMSFYDAKNEVLQTSRYDVLTGRRINLREVISEWIRDALYRFFSQLNFNVPQGGLNYDLNILSITFVVIGVILVVVAGIVLYRTLRNARKPELHDLSDIFEELAQKNYTVNELLKLSDNAEDRRLSVRYRYIATLLALNEQQIIEIKPSATNALILRQIKETSPALLPLFECTADAFHRAWFGYKNISDPAFDNFANAVNSIISGDSHA